MKCKKCGSEIKDGEKFCTKCGKKVKGGNTKIILFVLGTIVVISIISVFIISSITHNNKPSNAVQNDINSSNVEETKNTSAESKIRQTLAEFCSEYDIEFEPTVEQMQELIELYNSNPSNFNLETLSEFLFSGDWLVRGVGQNYDEEVTMPNLVGLKYGDLRTYLDNNGLSFITDINYTTDKSLSFGDIYPYEVLSTSPDVGEILNRGSDTSIRVYTNEVNGIKEVLLKYKNEKDWETKYFGKTIKVQIGSAEDSAIEGVIGKDFYNYNGKYLKASQYSYVANSDIFWQKVAAKKVAYILPHDFIIRPRENLNQETDHYVKGKIYIDNQLIKEVEFEYLSSTITGEI